ncbi:hypothetical protein B0H16DRAFT_1740107 [Mycena metata]|uniref:Uncharacterized protein n=1 Tax=Mycena metata TaxID=1033252 RepID=A0AAD7MIT0_9AGAR|nr:hypothetical protein B0H16DRAFT_1740107 [Mycena metata]
MPATRTEKAKAANTNGGHPLHRSRRKAGTVEEDSTIADATKPRKCSAGTVEEDSTIADATKPRTRSNTKATAVPAAPKPVKKAAQRAKGAGRSVPADNGNGAGDNEEAPRGRSRQRATATMTEDPAPRSRPRPIPRKPDARADTADMQPDAPSLDSASADPFSMRRRPLQYQPPLGAENPHPLSYPLGSPPRDDHAPVTNADRYYSNARGERITLEDHCTHNDHPARKERDDRRCYNDHRPDAGNAHDERITLEDRRTHDDRPPREERNDCRRHDTVNAHPRMDLTQVMLKKRARVENGEIAKPAKHVRADDDEAPGPSNKRLKSQGWGVEVVQQQADGAREETDESELQDPPSPADNGRTVPGEVLLLDWPGPYRMRFCVRKTQDELCADPDNKTPWNTSADFYVSHFVPTSYPINTDHHMFATGPRAPDTWYERAEMLGNGMGRMLGQWRAH